MSNFAPYIKKLEFSKDILNEDFDFVQTLPLPK